LLESSHGSPRSCGCPSRRPGPTAVPACSSPPPAAATGWPRPPRRHHQRRSLLDHLARIADPENTGAAPNVMACVRNLVIGVRSRRDGQPRRHAAPPRPRPTPTPRHPRDQPRMNPTPRQNDQALAGYQARSLTPPRSSVVSLPGAAARPRTARASAPHGRATRCRCPSFGPPDGIRVDRPRPPSPQDGHAGLRGQPLGQVPRMGQVRLPVGVIDTRCPPSTSPRPGCDTAAPGTAPPGRSGRRSSRRCRR
jgi:hypothetical protein